MTFHPVAATSSAGVQPYQFQVSAYGAKGDGKVVADVVTNSTTTITSATAAFTAADVGKAVMINGANGTTSAPLQNTNATTPVTIVSVTNATTAVLSAAATVTTTGCQMVWGTDDTAAINSAVAAAKTYALAHNYFAEIVFDARVYMLANGLTQTSGAGGVVNSQIPIPYPNVNGTTEKLVISFKGAGAAGGAQFFQSTIPNVQGTCLISTLTAPNTPDGTFGIQSVIGGSTGGGAFTGGFANTQVNIDGISVFCGVYTNIKAYHFGFLAAAEWGSFSANIFAPALQGTHPQLTDLPAQGSFQATRGIGCIFPYTGNNDDVNGRRFCAEGYETGAVVADHFTCLSMAVIYSDLAVLFDSTQGASGTSHLISIPNLSVEAYNGGFLANGGYATVAVNLDAETIGGTANPAYDVKDQGSNLFGTFTVADNNTRTQRSPTVVNCANLEVVNYMMGPGVWSGAPGVPATTVAATNTSWRPASVYLVSGGAAVTVIKVNSTTTGLTLGTSGAVTVRVPAGATITLTYASTAPTWTWILD